MTRPASDLVVALAAISLFACKGVIGGADEKAEDGPATGVRGEPQEPARSQDSEEAPRGDPPTEIPADVGLRRLETDQLIHTVTSRLLMFYDEVPWPVDRYIDELSGHPAYQDATPPEQRAQNPIPFGDVAPLIIQAANRLAIEARVIFGDCAVDDDASNDEACLREFFIAYGPAFWRREVPEEEVTAFIEPFVTGAPLGAPALRRFFAALMLSPHFQLVVEHGQPATEGDATVPLTAYELASRLSYFLWRDAPDQELLDSAATGSLFEEEELVRQATRLLEHPKSEVFFRALALHWLHIDKEDLNYRTNPGGKRFLYAQQLYFVRNDDGSIARDAEGQYQITPELQEYLDSLKDLALEELGEFLRYVVVDDAGTLGDVFLTEIAPARDERLAGIYGVPVWDGESAPPAHARGRGGILGRVAFLGSTAPKTRPIIRGVRIWKHVLCRDLAEPPDDVMFTPPPEGPYTTRELVTHSTADPTCATCHGRLNDFAFALEGLDNVGQPRTAEPFFGDVNIGPLDDPSSGVADTLEDSWLPIDASAEPQLAPDQATPVNGAYELARAIADYRAPEASVLERGGFAGDAYRCFASNLIGFGLDGALASEEDALAVEEAVRSDSVRDAIIALVRTPSFRQRTFGSEEGS